MEASKEFTPEQLFERWVIAPLDALRRLPEGDGAFVAMGMALALYERYIKSALERAGRKETPEEMWDFGASDLSVDPETFRRFWGMFRDGIQHSLQPKLYTSNGIRWGWELSSAYSKSPKIIEPEKDLRIILIEPWQFIDHVIGRFRSAPELIDFKDSWKLGTIEPTKYAKVKTPITWSAPPANKPPEPSPAPDIGTGIFPPKAS
jgi:hypothetical protein